VRPFALLLRAGAVLVAVVFVFSLLIDGTPAPVAVKAKAAAKPEKSAKAKKSAAAVKSARAKASKR